MTTLAIGNCDEPCPQTLVAPARPAFGFSTLAGRLSDLRAWYLHRRTLRRLEGIEPRLLRDMGVDPEDVYGRLPRLGTVNASLFGGVPATHRRRQ